MGRIIIGSELRDLAAAMRAATIQVNFTPRSGDQNCVNPNGLPLARGTVARGWRAAQTSSRDYPEGTMHLVNPTVGSSFTVNPLNCLFRGTLQKDSQIIGGIGLFANASDTFTGTISRSRSDLVLTRSTGGACRGGPATLRQADREVRLWCGGDLRQAPESTGDAIAT